MGLDMYLELKRDEFASCYTKGNELKREYPPFLRDNFPNLPPVQDVRRQTYYEVGYWRKANQIHNWFMQNCARRDEHDNPIDDCKPIEITVDELEKLLDTCKKVLADHSLAESLLPTKSGFFFGSTGYDEVYFRDVEKTIEIIEPVLEFLKKIEDKCDYNDLWSVVYQASW